MTCRGNVNGSGLKFSASASFDDNFLAYFLPPSNRDGRDSEFGVGLDGPTSVTLPESYMRKTH